MNGSRRSARILAFKTPPKRRLALSVARAGLGVLSRLSSRLCAAAVETLFRTPPPQRRTAKERGLLLRGVFREAWVGGRRLATWRWGEGPAVLLVHGWGGHAARLSAFVDPLCQAGFSVVAFDAPAHGASDGLFASLPEFAAAIERLAADTGPLAGIVGHSLGGAAAALAMKNGLCVPRAVFLAPPDDPERYSERFATLLHVPQAVRDEMKARLAARYGVTWDDVRASRCAPGGGCRLLVFHDRGDFRVPLKDGATIAAAWPGAELVVTRGFGHHKILRHPDVVARSVRFLQGRAAPVAVVPVEPLTRRPAPLVTIRGEAAEPGASDSQRVS